MTINNDASEEEDTGGDALNEGSRSGCNDETTISETVNDDGTITRVFYTRNQQNQKVQVTQTIRRYKRVTRVPPGVVRRRALSKFGKCSGVGGGPEYGITAIGELVEFENGVKAMGQVNADSVDELKTGMEVEASWEPIRVQYGENVYGIHYTPAG